MRPSTTGDQYEIHEVLLLPLPTGDGETDEGTTRRAPGVAGARRRPGQNLTTQAMHDALVDDEDPAARFGLATTGGRRPRANR